MTKTAFRCVQIVLLFYGVFGADEDDVSVMEGDSVTLNPDLTQIKKFNLIEWRFRDPIIAHTDGKDISYPSHTGNTFRDRLQLDVTGSLTIKNMKTKHSGLYELKIRHGAGTAERKFSVTVYESASDPGESEMKSVSVKEGDRVTFQTGVTQISGDELIVWRFGDEGKLIAKADIEAKSSPLYYDERFRDRLELELNQTGSLIITNTRSTDCGFYTVKISSSKQTLYKRFSVSVSEPGLSPGGKAGIVLVVLAAVAAAVAAAAVGFIYYRRKISELQKQIYSHQFTLDLNTAHKNLRLSDNGREITETGTDQQYPDHPDRFNDSVHQVLCRESVSERCFWELEWRGEVDIAVSYKSIIRKGTFDECVFGYNDQSWALYCHDSRYRFKHNNIWTDLSVKPLGSRIGVFVDHSAGTLSFYRVSDTMSLIHTVQTTFTQPLCPGIGFGFGYGSVKLC